MKVRYLIPLITLLPLSAGATIDWAPGVSMESGWFDANKKWNGDDYMCWAGQSSNMINYWQKWYVNAGNELPAGAPMDSGNNTRKVFDYFQSYWTNSGGNSYYGIPWYMTGGFIDEYYPTDSKWSQFKTRDTTHPGFFKDVYATENAMEEYGFDYETWTQTSVGDFVYCYKSSMAASFTYKDISSFTTCLSSHLEHSVIGLDVEFRSSSGEYRGGHALTAWGAEYGEDGNVVAMYITDSDDNAVELVRVSVTSGADGVYLEGYGSAPITEVTNFSALSVAQFFPIPEPSMFGMLAGLGALAWVASRRRRK